MIILYVFILYVGIICSGQEILYERAIVHPCPRLTKECVRSFFATYGHCTPQYGRYEDIYYIDWLPVPFPHANLTFIWKEAWVTGLGNWKTVELFVNRMTHNLVFEVEFDLVTTYSPASIIRYHHRGREPTELMDYFGVKHIRRSLTMTVPFDSDNGIRWPEKDIYTNLGNPDMNHDSSSLNMIYGEGLINSDPEVQNEFNTMKNNSLVSMKEASVVLGPYYYTLFFLNNVCL